MRKTFVATAVAAILSAGAFLPGSASAMTLTAPAGVRTAIDEANGVEQVRHRCFRARGGWVCPRHRKRVIVGAYPYYAAPVVGVYPSVGVGWGWGWGGHHHTTRVVRHRHIHRGHRR